MKNKIAILVIIATLLIPLLSMGQNPPPPPPGHGESGNVPGGGAPAGSGLLIMLGLGGAYGGYKFFRKQVLVDNKCH